MEVRNHSIGFPAAEELYCIGINVSARRAVVPPARREWASISLGWMLSGVGPTRLIPTQSVLVMRF